MYISSSSAAAYNGKPAAIYVFARELRFQASCSLSNFNQLQFYLLSKPAAIYTHQTAAIFNYAAAAIDIQTTYVLCCENLTFLKIYVIIYKKPFCLAHCLLSSRCKMFTNVRKPRKFDFPTKIIYNINRIKKEGDKKSNDQ